MVKSPVNFNEQEGITKKGIVLKHISKISELSCQEFTAGYWEKKPMRTQGGVMFSEVYHQDVRDAYCNAVEFLLDIIHPSADDSFNELVKELEGEEEGLSKEDKNLFIKEKIKLRRKLLKEIFFLFERIKYFDETDVYRDSVEPDIIDGENDIDIS